MTSFNLTIVSERKIHFSGKTAYCGVQTLNGSIGFEADHEPFMGVLKPDSLITYGNGDSGDESLKIHDGMLSFKNNDCTITISVFTE
jgi:F0F1-type ATP synthase epsilon subunit